MKTVSKGITWAVAGLLLSIGLAALAVRIFFPAERVKALILQRLEAALNRQVTIERVSIGLIKGVSLEKLRISERPTFAQGTFVEADGISVYLRLFPLLRKQVEISSLRLGSPTVRIVRREDGQTFNFSDLTQKSTEPVTAVARVPGCAGLIPCAEAAPPPAPVAAPSAFQLRISSLRLQNGRIVFEDRSPAKQSAVVSNANVSIDNFRPDAAFPVQGQADIQTMGVTANVKSSLRMDTSAARVQVNPAVLTIGQTKLTLKGDVEDYNAPAPRFDLAVGIDALRPGDLSPLVKLPPALQWTGAGTGAIALKGTTAQAAVDGRIRLDAVALVYKPSFQKPAGTPLSAAFRGTVRPGQSADLPSFEATLADLTAKGRVKLDNLAAVAPALNLQVETNEFAPASLLALLPGAAPKDLALSGTARLKATVQGTTAAHRTQATLYGKSLAIASGAGFRKPAGVPLEAQLQADVSEGGSSLHLNPLTLTIARLQATVEGTYQTKGQRSLAALKIRTNEFPLEDAAVLLPSMASVKMTGPGRLDVNVNGGTDAPAVSGQAHLKNATFQLPGMVLGPTEAAIQFSLPNALATAAQQRLKTSGQWRSASLRHDNYQADKIEITWDLTDLSQDLAHVNGTAALRHGGGYLRNLEQLAMQSKAARLLLTPIQQIQKVQAKGLLKQIGLPDLNNIRFDSLRGDYGFRDGLMDVRTLTLTGEDLTLDGKGTIGLAGVQPLNLMVQAVLKAGAIRGTVGQWLQDSSGRPTFKFRISGTAADPKTSWDAAEVQKRAIQSIGQELLKRIGGAPQGGTSAPPAAAPQGQPSGGQADQPPAADPVQDLRKLKLKDLFK